MTHLLDILAQIPFLQSGQLYVRIHELNITCHKRAVIAKIV